MSRIKVVIADDEPIIRMDLRELLLAEGYQVVGEGADGFDAIEICKEMRPDLALLDVKMPLLDGLSAASIIYEENLAETIIMLTAYSDREFVRAACDRGVAGYLVKPLTVSSLVPSIELAVARSKEMHQLKRDIRQISDRLESRSVVEKAKGLLMANENMTEQAAYDYIRKLSQSKKLSMRRVAEIMLRRMGAG